MNTFVQTTLVILTVSYAIYFLVRKFVWKPKTASKKACGNEGCGCD